MGIWDTYKKVAFPSAVFDPGKGSRLAQDQWKKAWAEAKGFQQPYNQAGLDQIGKLTGAEDKLLDPAALQSEWAEGYEMSPYAQQMQKEAEASGMESAGSQGLLGSSASINNIQQGATNIMQKDRQQYMNDLMEKYKAGLGIGQDIFGKGAQTAANLGGQAMQFGQGMGNLKAGEQESTRQMMMDFMKMIAGASTGGATSAAMSRR